MKRFLLFAGLLSAVGFPAWAQNVRYSVSLPSISSNTTAPYLVANVPPNSLTLAVCNAPANQLPCTNFATTYSSAGAACANGSQDTPDPQPSACQPTADAQGNIGFWAAPGTYDWTACVQNTTTCYGPYRVTLALADTNGTCTMSGGQCSAINFATAYKMAPTCTVTWTGTGTLTGILSSQRSSSGLQPKSSVNSDSAVVDWNCQGNPN